MPKRTNDRILFSLREEGLTRYRRLPDNHVLLYDASTHEFFLYHLNPEMQGVGLLIDSQPHEFVAANTDNKGRIKKESGNGKPEPIQAGDSGHVEATGGDTTGSREAAGGLHP